MAYNLIYTSPAEKLTISYGISSFADTNCIIGQTNRGVCFLAFGDNTEQAITEMKSLWPNGAFTNDQDSVQLLADKLFSGRKKDMDLLVQGTEFQRKIWQLLLDIPFAGTVSYEEMAEKFGGKNYTRAAANAIAKNNISYLIPCHRVINKSGNVNKYRWGVEVKKNLLEWEREQAN